MRKIILSLFILLFLLQPAHPAFAQDSAEKAIYIVQKGDTLGLIAIRFGVTIDALIQANNLTNPNSISVGMQLVIPGLEGIKGVITTETVQLGETLRSLSLRSQIPITTIIKLNRITSPEEIFVGSQIVVTQSQTKNAPRPSAILQPQQTLLEAAALHNTSPWSLVETHRLASSQDLLPTETIYLTGQEPAGEGPITSPFVSKIEINPLPLIQGQTTVIRVTTRIPTTLTGTFGNNELHFFSEGENRYVAMQGIYAMAEPGLFSLKIKGVQSNAVVLDLNQMLVLKSGFFSQEKLVVEPSTIDPAVTKPEEDQIANLVKNVTNSKLWKGVFRHPVDQPICYRSGFGNRRSYNNGALLSFHAGLDYGVCANLNIYAPAPGIVVFSGPLAVRGNATFIDHGWGIYSGYFHQKETRVQPGSKVETGQMIGLIGATGRVTGPHLHWEIWVNGAQVNPLTWLEKSYP